MTVRIEHGDSLEVLPRLAAEGVLVDAVITDAPYHLTSIAKRFGNDNAAPAKSGKSGAFKRASRGFMNQKWDGGDIAFRPEIWRGVYDLMKPGAHLIAFGGSRGYHRMAVAIEDAGFEVRDSILDIIAADDPVRLFMASLTQEQMGAFLRCIEDSQFGGLLAWIYGSGFPKSHPVGKDIEASRLAGKRVLLPGFEGTPFEEDWGTALKPAFEPIILARKPLAGTVNDNVLAYGTGALNIGGCRIGSEERETRAGGMGRKSNPVFGKFATAGTESIVTTEGRHPANIVHDGSAEVVSAFPNSAGTLIEKPSDHTFKAFADGGLGGPRGPRGYDDNGSAARFFYSAKAESEDRLGSKHPTVKPVNLMRWLVRLVTAPGATVLDPFAGTGTTGAAAYVEGRNAILVEREAEYVEDIKRRLDFITGKAAHSGGVMKPVNDAEKVAAAKGADLPLFGRAS